MKLSELMKAPEGFGPTKRFIKFYGRYGGPGNAGNDPHNPNPIDIVDEVCREHDICYFTNGYGNKECDKKFVERLDGIIKNEELNSKQKLAAKMMQTYFKATGLKKPINS